MYEYIKGNITEINPTYLIIENAAGIGFYLIISLQTFSEIQNKSNATIYTHFIPREDAHILYGFSSKIEREIFRLLIGVSGVGGNTARMILSTYNPHELANIIASENAALLKNVKGLGLKTAQKIIVELKDKISTVNALDIQLNENHSLDNLDIYNEALEALNMLGFPKNAAEKVLKPIIKNNPQISVEELVRQALKNL